LPEAKEKFEFRSGWEYAFSESEQMQNDLNLGLSK